MMLVTKNSESLATKPTGEAGRPHDDLLLTTQEAAKVVGLASATLETWRSRPPRDMAPPSFLRLGRAIRYRRSTLVAWLENREFTTTTAADQEYALRRPPRASDKRR